MLLPGSNCQRRLPPIRPGEPKRWRRRSARQDVGLRRNKTGSRVPPTDGDSAGGERSAKHRDEQGAAGFVKGLSAQPLYPFTCGVQVIFCEK
ncbi:hypothetical protein TUM12370_35050 [Salmonella enterica subsp. enterica serovar Choleraesuis]|nr:hypothetical protein TUM12370_35050 [Salmonella enterica subsp. enterica serovar Choleraesuis]